MSDALSELNFKDDLDKVLLTSDAQRWKLEKTGPLEILVSLSPINMAEDVFQARLLWSAYPAQPPSLKFRDPATGRLDVKSAWPLAGGLRPDSLDACVSWCAEGFSLHPEWRTDPRYMWKSDGNVLLKVIRTLQERMDNTFQGRFKG